MTGNYPSCICPPCWFIQIAPMPIWFYWIVVFFWSLAVPVCGAEKENIFPPFAAECRISTKAYPEPGAKPVFEHEVLAHFIYTNNSWDIDYSVSTPSLGTVYCREIKDGIRWIAAATNSQELLDQKKIFTVANALPQPGGANFFL